MVVMFLYRGLLKSWCLATPPRIWGKWPGVGLLLCSLWFQWACEGPAKRLCTLFPRAWGRDPGVMQCRWLWEELEAFLSRMNHEWVPHPGLVSAFELVLLSNGTLNQGRTIWGEANHLWLGPLRLTELDPSLGTQLLYCSHMSPLLSRWKRLFLFILTHLAAHSWDQTSSGNLPPTPHCWERWLTASVFTLPYGNILLSISPLLPNWKLWEERYYVRLLYLCSLEAYHSAWHLSNAEWIELENSMTYQSVYNNFEK